MCITREIGGVTVVSRTSVPAEYHCSFSGITLAEVIIDPVCPHLAVKTWHTARTASSVDPPEIDSLVNERIVQYIHKRFSLKTLRQIELDPFSRRSVRQRNRLHDDSSAAAPIIH